MVVQSLFLKFKMLLICMEPEASITNFDLISISKNTMPWHSVIQLSMPVHLLCNWVLSKCYMVRPSASLKVMLAFLSESLNGPSVRYGLIFCHSISITQGDHREVRNEIITARIFQLPLGGTYLDVRC